MSTERQRQYLDALAVEQGFRDTMEALELMAAEAVRLVEQLVHDAALEPGGADGLVRFLTGSARFQPETRF